MFKIITAMALLLLYPYIAFGWTDASDVPIEGVWNYGGTVSGGVGSTVNINIGETSALYHSGSGVSAVWSLARIAGNVSITGGWQVGSSVVATYIYQIYVYPTQLVLVNTTNTSWFWTDALPPGQGDISTLPDPKTAHWTGYSIEARSYYTDGVLIGSDTQAGASANDTHEYARFHFPDGSYIVLVMRIVNTVSYVEVSCHDEHGAVVIGPTNYLWQGQGVLLDQLDTTGRRWWLGQPGIMSAGDRQIFGAESPKLVAMLMGASLWLIGSLSLRRSSWMF